MTTTETAARYAAYVRAARGAGMADEQIACSLPMPDLGEARATVAAVEGETKGLRPIGVDRHTGAVEYDPRDIYDPTEGEER